MDDQDLDDFLNAEELKRGIRSVSETVDVPRRPGRHAGPQHQRRRSSSVPKPGGNTVPAVNP